MSEQTKQRAVTLIKDINTYIRSAEAEHSVNIKSLNSLLTSAVAIFGGLLEDEGETLL